MWLNDGSRIRLRPVRRNHVWSYDFVEAKTQDDRKVRLMTLIDEFTRECLAIRGARRIYSLCVLETMADAMLVRGVPEHIRFDNEPEMTANIVRSWLASVGAKTLYIEPGSPGRMAIAKASTASCGTNYSTGRSSTASRRPRSSSSNGANTTHRQTPFIAGISATSATDLHARATPYGWNAGYAVVSLTLVQNIRQANCTEDSSAILPDRMDFGFPLSLGLP